MISLPNKDIQKDIIKLIWDYNAQRFLRFEKELTLLEFDPTIKPKPPIFFLPYFEWDLIKSSAALKIQKVFRRYISDKISGFGLRKVIQQLKIQK